MFLLVNVSNSINDVNYTYYILLTGSIRIYVITVTQFIKKIIKTVIRVAVWKHGVFLVHRTLKITLGYV